MGTKLITGLALLLAASVANAASIGYNLSWTGSGGYTMTGMFSFDDSLLGTGPIDETQIDTLMIEGFLNGGSLGTWDLADGQGAGALAFNFNFDATTEQFLTWGHSASSTGQQWNALGNPGMGFSSGNSMQGLNINGAGQVGAIPSSQSTLVASRKSVPEPGALVLLGAAAFGYRFRRRRRNAS